MSLLARPRPALYTFEDFCALVKDKQKADLIDGVIYMSSPDNTDASRLFTWLLTVINLYLCRRKLGEVFGLRIAFRLDNRNGPEPDIGFVINSRLHLVKRGYVDGPPDAAMEIVSPESIERDYEKKRLQFEKARVPEYWIIDEMEQRVTLLRLDKNGQYAQVLPRKGVLKSKVIREFWLREAWLWKKPLPDPLRTLKAIAKGGR